MHHSSQRSTSISIGIVGWIENDTQLPELSRCLESIQDFNVYFINGKWNDIVGNYPSSTDKANDLIDSFSNVIHIHSPNQSEVYNRNKYLQLSWKDDYLFWVDTDEWIIMPQGKDFFINGIIDHDFLFSSTLHYYSDIHGGPSKQRRLLKYPGFLRHKNKHNEIYLGDKEVLRSGESKAPRGLVIYSDKNYRTKERESKMLNRTEGIII